MSSLFCCNLILIFFLAIGISGCASNPYKNRMVEDGMGGEVERFFAYGKFCGEKYPANQEKVGSNGILRTLSEFYPPVDDFDAICYAHDYCYDFPETNHVSCDDVFHRMFIDSQFDYKGEGCWNLANDITIAFFGKNWEKGNSGSETAANRIVGTTLGIPTAMFWAILKYPITPFLSNPKEGTCNLGDEPDFHAVFMKFEGLYKDALFNKKHVQIKIPIPGPQAPNRLVNKDASR